MEAIVKKSVFRLLVSSLILLVLIAGCRGKTPLTMPTFTVPSINPGAFHSELGHSTVAVRASWGTAEGPESIAITSMVGDVAFNSWGQANYWAHEKVEGDSHVYSPGTVMSQIPEGGAYVALVEINGPPVMPGSEPPEYTLNDLSGLITRHDWRQDASASAQFISFYKWGRSLQLEVGCKAGASDATVAALNDLLQSWRFDEVRVGDPGSMGVDFFPVQKAGYEVLAYPTALATGRLVLDNGYLRLTPGTDPRFGGEKLLIIWPPGSTLQIENGTIQVLNQGGKPIARTEEILQIGGGEIPSEIVTKYTGQTMPDNCPGPYWLAAPGVYNTPTPANTNRGPTPPVMNDEFKAALEKEPLLLEATIYAQHYEVSVDEALKRLKLQSAFPGLGSALENNEPATFGGLWIQHEPEYRIVVAFTRDGEETLKKYASYITEEVAPYIEVRTVKTTLAELLHAQQEIASAFRDLDIPNDSSTNIIENCVDVTVGESIRPQVEEAIRSGRLVVPDNVRINYR
jgi:hypothetical protein